MLANHPEEYTYRSASIKDKAELLQLAIASYGPYTALLDAENANKLHNGLRDEKKMESLITSSTCFVCLYKNKIVGMAFIVLHGNPWDVFLSEWAYIRMVGIHPPFQGKGIASQLMKMCINFAKENKEKTIALHTSEFMNAARHLYEKIGFKKHSEIEPRFGARYWLYLLELN